MTEHLGFWIIMAGAAIIVISFFARWEQDQISIEDPTESERWYREIKDLNPERKTGQ